MTEGPNQTLLSALLVAAVVVGSLSGVGLVLAALGLGRGTGWQRWALWLPPVFGISLVVGVGAFVLLLISGIR